MCFACHFNICAHHAREAEEYSAAGLTIVTETSIWATRVLATSDQKTRDLATGDQMKGDLATGGDHRKGDLATRDQKKGDLATRDQDLAARDQDLATSDQDLATSDQKKSKVEEERSLLPEVEGEQLKALSLEAMLPGIFPGKASIIVEEKKEESVGGAEGALPDLSQYHPATNLPKNSVVDIV